MPSGHFPDVVAILVDALETLVGGGEHTAYVADKDLVNKLPYIRVRAVPGGERDRLNDYAVIDIDVFAATYDAARELAEDVYDWMVGPPPTVTVFDRVEGAGPTELPWDDSDPPRVRRFGATYKVVSRRRYTA